jgi:hypothetical protein
VTERCVRQRAAASGPAPAPVAAPPLAKARCVAPASRLRMHHAPYGPARRRRPSGRRDPVLGHHGGKHRRLRIALRLKGLNAGNFRPSASTAGLTEESPTKKSVFATQHSASVRQPKYDRRLLSVRAERQPGPSQPGHAVAQGAFCQQTALSSARRWWPDDDPRAAAISSPRRPRGTSRLRPQPLKERTLW